MGNSSKNSLNRDELVTPRSEAKIFSSTILANQLKKREEKISKQTMDRYVKNLQVLSDIVSVHSNRDEIDLDKLQGYEQADVSLKIFQAQRNKPLAQSHFDESQQIAESNKLVFSSNVDQSQFFKLKSEVKIDGQIIGQSSQLDEQEEDDILSDFTNFDWDSIRFQQQDIFNTPFSHRIKQLKQQSYNNFLENNQQEKK